MKVSTTPLAIEAQGLVKRYGDKAALDGVDLDVPRGAVCALLGPNGAGKTTAVRVLTTLTEADAGTARVAGFDVATDPLSVRRSIGLAAQDATVDGLLTGHENLTMIGELHHLGRRRPVVGADRSDPRGVPGFRGALGGPPPAVDEGSRSVTAPAEGGVGAIARLADALEEAGIAVEDLGLRQPTLDDAFLTLTGM